MKKRFSKYVSSKSVSKATFIISLVYFGFWWSYSLDILPGLHGDEAWFGLKAAEFNSSGIHQIHGMTYYTGIIQPAINSLFFKLIGVGVFEMRVSGIIFNLAAIIILYFSLCKAKNRLAFGIFLIILSQSALYLTSPRVAWEVNTFTFFFVSVLISVTITIRRGGVGNANFLSSLIFLFVMVLGSYNHIIFSCIAIAGMAAFLLWSIYNGRIILGHLGTLILISLINIGVLFLWMQNAWEGMSQNPLSLLVVVITVITVESVLITRFVKFSPAANLISPRKPISKFFIYTSRLLIYSITTICFIVFLLKHGVALLDVFANYRLLMHVYSYKMPVVLSVVTTIGAVILLGYLIFYLTTDIFGPKKSIFSFFIVSYLGCLSLYVTQNSFRYYLTLYLILALYLAFKISKERRQAIILYTSLTVVFLIVNVSLVKIFSPDYKITKALKFQIGNSQVETSAHFLPNKPVIDFLKNHQIGNIHYRYGRYFLQQPIKFYKLIHPWTENPSNSMTLSFDYDGTGNNGYKFE